MPDREKVIKGLEWCMNEKHDCYREKGCPYENEGEDIGCKYALHRDALALLKAQEPVKPVRNKEGVYHCGSCGKACVGYEAEYSHSIIKVENYCHKCGRRVKWE